MDVLCVDADAGDLSKRTDQIEGELESVEVADDFENDVRATVGRCGEDCLVGVGGIWIERDGTEFLGFGESGGNRVDGEDPGAGLCEVLGAGDGADADRATADDGDCQIGEMRWRKVFEETGGSEVAGGKDVGHQDEEFFWDRGWGTDHGGVGEGNSDVFCLSTVDGVCWATVAEEDAVWTSAGLTSCAVETGSTGCVEGNNDVVSNLKVLHIVTKFDDVSYELVAADEAWWTLLVTTVVMQVSATKSGRRDLKYCICRLLDDGYGLVFHRDFKRCFENHSSHGLRYCCSHDDYRRKSKPLLDVELITRCQIK